MKLKLYTLFSILAIVIVGIYVHLNIPKSFVMSINGAMIDLPVSIWVIIPMILMFIASFIHMAFYWFLNYMKIRSLNKDISHVKDVALGALKGDPSIYELEHRDLAPVSRLLKSSQIIPMNGNIKTEDVEIDKLLFQIDKVNGGVEGDLSSFKLPTTSPLAIKNASIKLKNNPKYAEKVLTKYQGEKFLIDSAIEKLSTYADRRKIDKYRDRLTVDAVINIISRYRSDRDSLDMSHAEIEGYIKNVGFKEKDFIKTIQKLKDQVSPDELLEIAFELKRDFPEAMDAWIYINLEYERLDEVNELLEASDDDEYLGFRKYLAVKNSGIQCALEEFIL